MKIAIVGYATEGRASYEYFTKRGHEVTICDANPAVAIPKEATSVLGNTYLDSLDRFDVIVRSAGIRPDVILAKNPGVEAKVTTAVNEFLAACPTKNVIGITGTKGKGTTSTLTAKMLEAAGKRVFLGGNIGRSPLEFIDEISPDDWVVLELSSFQLCDITHSPHIAVCLMVVPEHLNWHTDMGDYTHAKANLFTQQSSDDVAIYFAENQNSKAIAGAGAGVKLPFYAPPGAWVNGNMLTIDGQEICATDELKLLGKHNWQNVCAAITAVWKAGIQDSTVIRNVVTTFTGLPYRLEFTADIDGVLYYNDSFGTTPETAIVAIEAFSGPKVVILGGSDKGALYDELATVIAKENVRQALLIGDQAGRIAASLDAVGFARYSDGGESMRDVVDKAKACAQAGDVVLLSTGCASFGMFKDYKDRGNQFNEAVRSFAASAQ